MIDLRGPEERSLAPRSPMLSGKQIGEVIDRTGVTQVTRILVVAASLGYLFDAFDNTMVGYLMPLISKDFIITPEWKGFLLSLGLWGGVLGMAFWGPVAEMKGRRFAFQGTVLSFSLFSGLAAATWSALSFGVTRFISGAGLAGFYPVDLAMVAEMTPTRIRGRLTSLITVLYPVGVILAGAATGFIALRLGWRPMFLVGALPALLAFLVRREVPESPRWLASKGRMAEAEESLIRMGARRETIDQVKADEDGSATGEAADQDQASLQEKFRELFSRKWLRANIVAWTLWIAGNFATWGVTLWLPTILMDVYHFTFVKGVTFLALTYAVGLLGRLCGVFLIDKVGRKALLVSSFVFAACGCLAFSMVKSPMPLLCSIMFFKFFDQQGSLTLMAYVPELFPTRLRVMGNGYAGSASRVTSALAPIMVGFLIAMHFFLAIWAIFAGVLLIGALIILVLGQETKGRILEECAS